MIAFVSQIGAVCTLVKTVCLLNISTQGNILRTKKTGERTFCFLLPLDDEQASENLFSGTRDY